MQKNNNNRTDIQQEKKRRIEENILYTEKYLIKIFIQYENSKTDGSNVKNRPPEDLNPRRSSPHSNDLDHYATAYNYNVTI